MAKDRDVSNKEYKKIIEALEKAGGWRSYH
jgi:hypothetical protein